MPIGPIENRIRLAGILVLLGLVVELVSLFWAHPTAFLFYLFLGATLMGLGILLFLLSLVSGGAATGPDKEEPRKDEPPPEDELAPAGP